MVLHVSPHWTSCVFQICVTDGSGQGNLPSKWVYEASQGDDWECGFTSALAPLLLSFNPQSEQSFSSPWQTLIDACPAPKPHARALVSELGRTFCPIWHALLCTLLEDQVKSDTCNFPSVHQTCKICSGVIFSLSIPYWVYFHWKDSNLNFQWPFSFSFCLNKNKYNFYLNCITPQCAKLFSLGSLWLSCHGYCWHFHLDTVLWALCPLHRLSGEPFVTCGLKHSSRHIHSTNH